MPRERPRSAPGVQRGVRYADEPGVYGSPSSEGVPEHGYGEYDEYKYGDEEDLDAEAEEWLHRVVGAAQETLNR